MNNNQIILNRLSQYLNFCEKSIDDSQIKAVTACGVSIKEAYILLLQEYLNLDYNFKREYLEEMVNIEDPTEYQNNQYYKDIIFKPIKINNWDIKYSNYEPYELFVVMILNITVIKYYLNWDSSRQIFAFLPFMKMTFCG